MTTIENKEIEESWVKQDWVYIKTALILAFFTAIEVFTYFESVHKAPEWLLVTTLSFLMVVKFFLVAGVFMHLKDDNSYFCHQESRDSGWDSPLKAAMEGITKAIVKYATSTRSIVAYKQNHGRLISNVLRKHRHLAIPISP